jgi:hypothetical protein
VLVIRYGCSISNAYNIQSLSNLPAWPDLVHFPACFSVSFSDGTKYEHLLKVRAPYSSIIYAHIICNMFR